MTDTPTTKTKTTLEQFIASVPDAPSSALGGPEASAPEKPVPTAAAVPEATAILKALKEGDLRALSDFVGEDPELVAEQSVKWAAARRKEAKLKADLDGARTEAAQWKPASELVTAIKGGAYDRVPELVELLTGEAFDTLMPKALTARHRPDPRVAVLSRQVADANRERDEARNTRSEKAFLDAIRDEIPADSPVRQFDGWEQSVATILRESVDPDLGEPKLSVKQAAARVLRTEREAFDRRAKVFGAPPPAARKSGGPSPVERAAPAAGAKTTKKSREEWFAEFAAKST